MLEIINLHVSIDNEKILKGVNLSIPKGEVHALFGPNGSGKTTLIMTIIGYPEYKVTEGQILFNDIDILNLNITERAKLGIGVSQQRPPTIKGVKLRDILNFYCQDNTKTQEYIDVMVEKFNIERFLNRDINSGFSGGEIKRLELFLLMVAQPTFLLLDEPDSGVDPVQLSIIGDVIKECLRIKDGSDTNLNRKTGLIITHSGSILDYVYTDKAHLLLDGIICCNGNPGIMLNQIKMEGYHYCIQCQKTAKKSFEVKL